MAKPYKPREPGSYKQAVAQLVQACGGQVGVAALFNVTAQHVARMTDEAFPKAEMTMARVLLLERSCGKRLVTEWMAAEQGCIVEPMQLVAEVSLPIVIGSITSELGQLLSAAAASAAKGEMTVAQARLVLDETHDCIAAVLRLRVLARERLNREAA